MFRKRTAPKTIEQFPAGTYYIGDPCYPFPEDDDLLWDEWCKIVNGNYEKIELWKKVFEFHGFKVASDVTFMGDGSYDDNFGNSYCVDSGCIGILPIELIRTFSKYDDESLKELGIIETFDAPFTVTFDNGKFTFGQISIDTEPHYEEEDMWPEEEDEDEE